MFLRRFVRHSKHREQRTGKRATTKDTTSTKREFDELSNRKIGCAIEQLQLTFPVQYVDL